MRGARLRVTLSAHGKDKRVIATSYRMAERIVAAFAFAFNVPPMFNVDTLSRQGWARSDYESVCAQWHIEDLGV